MAGAITQNPIGIGRCVVESALKALKGEKLPKIIDTGFHCYDKSNIPVPKGRPPSSMIDQSSRDGGKPRPLVFSAGPRMNSA
jgi:hypothetical protein